MTELMPVNWLNRCKGPVSVVFGLFFLNVGIQHFTNPAWFEPIVPATLDDARFWVHASGVVEILVGLGLIVPQTRQRAGLATAVTLVALYWANLYMWMENVPLDGRVYETHWHVLRALAQVMMILVALWIGEYILVENTDAEEEASPNEAQGAPTSSG